MRKTNVPDDPPPLVESASASRYDPTAGGFPAVAAKLSLCAGLFSLLLGNHAATAKVRLSLGAQQGVYLVCVLLVAAGLALALWALISNRKSKRRGVTGFAIPALLINVTLAALYAYSFMRVQSGGGQ
jgi:hypothetical protein